MRIPLSWLREFAPVPADASAEDVLATLVKVGLEEEDVHRPTDEISGRLFPRMLRLRTFLQLS